MKVKINWPRFLQGLFKRSSEKNYQGYDTIKTLPIGLWFDLHESNDYQRILRSGKASNEECEILFNICVDEYIQEFGISSHYEEILELRRELWIDKIEYALHKNRTVLNYIQRSEVRLKELTKVESKSDSYGAIASIEKYLGYSVDEQVCPVIKFYKYIEMAQKEADRNEQK